MYLQLEDLITRQSICTERLEIFLLSANLLDTQPKRYLEYEEMQR